MAFEIPLESDRVDDSLNLFSLVRAPVIGLLWIFGDRASKEEEAPEEHQLPDGDIIDIDTDGNSTDQIFDCKAQMKRSFSKRNSLKPAPASLIGSDISDIGEIRDSLDTLNLDCLSSGKINQKGQIKKELSWSDESGKRLVEYVSESSLHEPKHTGRQPVKSAMSRSRSIRDDANRLAMEKLQPEGAGFVKHHNMVEPFSSGNSGIESPQWGWYINTTPPTPPMYYARPQKSRKPDSSSDTSDISSSNGSAVVIDGSSLSSVVATPNPVFQNLHNKHKAQPVAWANNMPL